MVLEAGVGVLPLLDWGRRFLPHYFSLAPSGLHRWLAAELDVAERGRRVGCVGPRGSAKSTVASVALPLRELLEGRERYIWLVSDTKSQALAHLENLRRELEENELLAEAYGAAVAPGAVWRAGTLELAGGQRIEAVGTGQRVRGLRRGNLRPTLIICDDLENDGHVESARARQRVRSWFEGMLLPAGSQRTSVVVVGTALHRDCLCHSLSRAAGWTWRTFESISVWPSELGMWDEWEQVLVDAGPAAAREFFEARRAAMQRGACVLWPASEDLYALMLQRAQIGRGAFDREKQCGAAGGSLSEWPESYFPDSVWFQRWPEMRARVMAIDASCGGDSRRGDLAAVVAVGLGADGAIYVQARLAREPVESLVAEAGDVADSFRPSAIGCESNQFQHLVGAQLAGELVRRGARGVVVRPVVQSVNKLVRIRRLGALLAARRLRFFDDSGTRLLVDQLREFPFAEHDDGPDALELAVRLLLESCGPAPQDDGLGGSLVR